MWRRHRWHGTDPAGGEGLLEPSQGFCTYGTDPAGGEGLLEPSQGSALRVRFRRPRRRNPFHFAALAASASAVSFAGVPASAPLSTLSPPPGRSRNADATAARFSSRRTV